MFCKKKKKKIQKFLKKKNDFEKLLKIEIRDFCPSPEITIRLKNLLCIHPDALQCHLNNFACLVPF